MNSTDTFLTVLYRKNILENTQSGGQKSSQKISVNQKEILKIIEKNPYITRKELSNKLNINSSAIQRNIEKLKSKGIIKRIGPDKGGYWEIQ